MKKFFTSFTLAETLITLAILGIITVVVIPNIIINYQKQQTVNRLKIAYHLLDDLTQRSYIENGFPPLNNSAIENIFSGYFGKYLNIDKDCGVNNTISGCFKNDTIYDNQNSDVNNYGSGYTFNLYYKVLLKNGMSLAVVRPALWKYSEAVFIVDIDGPQKGPSKVGVDIFIFNYYSPTINSTSCQNVGIYPANHNYNLFNRKNCNVFDRNSYLSNCATPHTASGWIGGVGCAGLIISDGWKISKDYPWTFLHNK